MKNIYTHWTEAEALLILYTRIICVSYNMLYMFMCGIQCNTCCCWSNHNKSIQATEESPSKGFYSLQPFAICGVNDFGQKKCCIWKKMKRHYCVITQEVLITIIHNRRNLDFNSCMTTYTLCKKNSNEIRIEKASLCYVIQTVAVHGEVWICSGTRSCW